MATATETVDLAMLSGVIAALGQVADISFEPVGRVMALLIASEVKSRFEQSKDPSDNPWADLKRRKGKPLVKSGLLMASNSAIGATGNICRIARTWLEFGSNVDYGGFHQRGTKWIPQRKFVGLNDRVIGKLEAVAVEYCADMANEAMGG